MNARLTSDDILEPSEAMRHGMDYYAHSCDSTALIEKLARLAPERLACMHGDGATLLRALGRRVLQ